MSGRIERDAEFYVGYLPAPPGLTAFVRRVAAGLAILVVVLIVGVAAAQRRLPGGTFEFRTLRTFEGVVYETPLPVLRTVAAGADDPAAAGTSFLLVGRGKAGIPASARGHHGRRVRLAGRLVYRNALAMIELSNESAPEFLGDAPAGGGRGAFESRGEMTLTGELVDTKCFLGVMRPATGKVHRACAVRCLSGGVPAGLLVRFEGMEPTLFLLAGRPGEGLDLDLEWAGRSIRVAGLLEIHDGLPVLRVDRARLFEKN